MSPIVPQDLLRQAADAARYAYCPYSRFPVGAAALSSEGAVFTGCNVENASYGLTVCAERQAVFAAVGAGHRTIVAIAVVAAAPPMPYPCGACRQVLSEFCAPATPIYIGRLDDLEPFETTTLANLLPHAFKLDAHA